MTGGHDQLNQIQNLSGKPKRTTGAPTCPDEDTTLAAKQKAAAGASEVSNNTQPPTKCAKGNSKVNSSKSNADTCQQPTTSTTMPDNNSDDEVQEVVGPSTRDNITPLQGAPQVVSQDGADASGDLKNFFGVEYLKKCNNGKEQKYWDCKICSKTNEAQVKHPRDPLSGRRHLAKVHKPIGALQHPAYRKMILIVAASPNGKIVFPDRHVTRQQIINMFCEYMINTKTRLSALIKAYSKSKHYDPEHPEAHEDMEDGDKVGKVRGISVKSRAGSQRKEKYRAAQVESGIENLTQPQVDMPAVDWFLRGLLLDETNESKASKLRALQMTDQDWQNVLMLLRLLQITNKAQQAFSSDTYPTLHCAIPALEQMYSDWSKWRDSEKYAHFRGALTAALGVIKKYYNLTTNSGVYIIQMILDPMEKDMYFKDNWSETEQKEVDDYLKKYFREWYEKLSALATTTGTAPTRPANTSSTLPTSRVMVVDSNDKDDFISPCPASSQSPWEVEYNKYMRTLTEDFPMKAQADGTLEKMGLVVWWGVGFPISLV
ncbi:hypothetical protein PQX77_020974 [Marasmius sp. AFHP31]|nr:hypothetical protein PQX77_020974 [Marasmius sp. AFHP31]